MNKYQYLSDLLNDQYEDQELTEDEFQQIKKEVEQINKSMKALPTSKEMDAKEDLVYLKNNTENLHENKKLTQMLLKDKKLEQLIINDLFQKVTKSFIKTRIYNNKTLIQVSDNIFQNLIKWISKNIEQNIPSLFSLLNVIIDPNEDFYRNNGQEPIYKYPFGDLIEIDEKKKQWIDNLKIGEQIDCMRSQYDHRNWSRAEILENEWSMPKVRYLCDKETNYIQNKFFNIDKIKSKSSDFEWRQNLKKDDEVDYFRFKNKWELYKIVKIVEEPLNATETAKTIHICKLQDIHKEYAEIFSTIVHSTNIAKPNQYSGKLNSQYQEDNLYLQQVDEPKWAIMRKFTYSSDSSIFIIKYINLFGKFGGMEYFLKVINNQKVNDQILNNVVTFFQTVGEYLVEPFIRKNGKIILQTIQQFLMENAKINLRNITQKSLNIIIKGISALAQRIYSLEQSEELAQKIKIKLAILCLKSDYLEKQFFGAKILQNISFQNNLNKELPLELMKYDVFNKIIKGHPHLIAKGAGVMKIMFDAGVLQNDDLMTLWSQIMKTDIESRNCLLKLLKQVIPNLKNNEIKFLAERMLESSNEIKESEIIDVLFVIQRMCYQNEELSDIIEIINNTLWGVIQSSKKLKQQFLKDVISNFVNSLENDFKNQYIQLIIDNIINEQRIYRNILLLEQMIKTTNSLIQFDLVKALKKNELTKNLIYKVIEQIKNQLDKNKRANLFNEEEKKDISNNLNLILEISEYLAEQSLINFYDIEKLWQVIFENNLDEYLLINWMKQYLLKQNNEIIEDYFTEFFEKYIVQVFDDSKEQFFYVLILVFMRIQTSKEYLIEKNVKMETNGIIENIEKKVRFYYLNTESCNLTSMSLLWDIYEKTNSISLLNQISSFFIKILTPPNNQNLQNREIYKKERNQLIEKINTFIMDDNIENVQKGIFILEKLLKVEEIQGFGLLNSFDFMQILPKIIIFVQQNTYYYKNSFNFTVSLNNPLFMIRYDISNQYQMDFDSVKILLHQGNELEELNQRQNSQSISELGFANHKKIHLTIGEYPLPKLKQSPILNEEGNDFSEKAKQVFQKIFERFSKDQKMTKKHFADFTSGATENLYCDEQDERVQYVFDQYDLQNKGYITIEQFLHFYLKCSLESKLKLHTVRCNLESLGYNKSLNLRTSSQMNQINYKETLRYQLAQNTTLFQHLIQLLQNEGDINKTAKIQSLLKIMTPNITFLRKFMSDPLKQLDQFSQSLFLIYYYSGILESVLFNREQLEKFLVFLNLSQTFNVKEFLIKLFSKDIAIFIKKNINFDKEIVINQYNLLSPFLGIIDKLLKIILETNKKGFLKKLDQLEEKEEEEDNEKLKEDKRKPSTVSNDNKSEQNEEEIKNPTIKVILNYQNLIDEKNIKEFSSNLDILQINQFCKSIIKTFIQNIEDFDFRKYQFLENVLSIWVNSIILDEQIIDKILSLNNYEDILILGLTHKVKNFRNLFVKYLSFLFENVNSFSLQIESSKIFIKNIQSGQNLGTQTIIEITSKLLGQLGKLKSNKNLIKEQRDLLNQFHFSKLFKEFSTTLKNYESKEKSFDNKDKTLTAMLTFMTKILEADENIIKNFNQTESENLMKLIFNECLFDVHDDMINFQNIKCKSTISRKAALQVITFIVKKNLKNSIYLIEKGFKPLCQFLPESSLSNYSNFNEKKCSLGFVGIKNPGCVCYMIAMLQQFYCTPAFRYGILMADDKKEADSFKVDGFELDDNVFHQLQKMFSYLDLSERKAYDPKAFCLSYRDITGERVDVMIQQDTQEFLNVIFDRLERALEITPFKGILDSVFGGKTASVFTCKNCQNQFSNEQLFYNLSLEVKNMDNIDDSFRKLNSEEIISDYTCENCKQKVDVSKKTYLKEVPNILIIHLQKIIFDLEYLANIKISSKYEFGKEINLKNYIFKEQTKNDQKNEQDMIDENDDEQQQEEDEEQYLYKLVGVVLHRGNAEYGHYTSLINVNRKDPNRPDLKEDVWYNFDDSRVSRYNMQNFDEDCFGEGEKKKGDYSSNLLNMDLGSSKSAYILVYDKVKKDKIHFHITKEHEEEKQRIIANLIDKKNFTFKDEILETDFYNLGKFIEKKHKMEINKDNSSLVLEEQLFNINFTQMFAKVVNNGFLPRQKDIQQYLHGQSELQITEEQKKYADLVIEILPDYINKIYCVTPFNNNFPTLMMTFNKALIINKDRIDEIYEKHFQNNMINFIDNLLTKGDVVIRKNLGSLICGLFKILIIQKKLDFLNIENNKIEDKKYIQLIDNFLDNIPRRFESNYRKKNSFFQAVLELCQDNDQMCAYIIKNNYLRKMIDFYISQVAKMSSERITLSTNLKLISKIIQQYEKLPQDIKNEILIPYNLAIKQLENEDFIEKILKENYFVQEDFSVLLNIMLFVINLKVSNTCKFIIKALKLIIYTTSEQFITILELLQGYLLNEGSQDFYTKCRFVIGDSRLMDDKGKNKKGLISYSYGLNRDILQRRNIRTFPSFMVLEKSLIDNLYKNRSYNETVCMLLIYFFLKMSNKSQKFFEYFIKLPGCNFNEPTIYCWFKDYIKRNLSNLIEKCQYGKKEIIDYCLNNVYQEFTQFEERLENKTKQMNLEGSVLFNNSKLEPLFSFNNQNWIIGKTNQVQLVKCFELEKDNLYINLHLINVSVIDQKADGNRILNFPQEDLTTDIFSEEYKGDPKLKSFIGEKFDGIYEEDDDNSQVDKMSIEEENKQQEDQINETQNQPGENDIFLNQDLILRISAMNKTVNCYYAKMRVYSDNEESNFNEFFIVFGLNRNKKDKLIHNVIKIDSTKQFKNMKFEISYYKLDFLNFVEYNDSDCNDPQIYEYN